MIPDGIRLDVHIPDRAKWLAGLPEPLEMVVEINPETGEISRRRRNIGNGISQHVTSNKSTFGTYRLVVKEIVETNVKTGDQISRLFLQIDGSLHKNHEGGTNAHPLTFADLKVEIVRLCTRLNLNPEKVKVSLLEIGYNIPFNKPVFDFLSKNLLTYRFSRFSAFRPGKDGHTLGYECCTPTEYRVKLYDKAKQYGLPTPLMRFELRFFKMRTLAKLGVGTLADLTNAKNFKGLHDLLLKAWGQVLLNDDTIALPKLKRYEDYFFMTQSANPIYWEQLHKANPQKCRNDKRRFVKLIGKHGGNYHLKINEAINMEGDKFMENLPIFPEWHGQKCNILPLFPDWQKGVKMKDLPFFPIKVKGENRSNENGHVSDGQPGLFCLPCTDQFFYRFSPTGNKTGRGLFANKKNPQKWD